MQEKKRPGKTSALPELRSNVTEVLVVNGRSFQPFIRTFSYTGENISKSNLGTLVGVFEIDEMSEDSAYIVNFLASVAKKEYFSNPRRGAIESFEAALHKINLALAELVKHGNVTWLGKFHGAIGVLEKNNFHFSVTGQAAILLFRNESFSDIGEGLTSEESKTHPIKTFVEVSSGRLALEDQIIMAAPELLALFTLEDLTKNARRMDHDRFTQFLKTALVNELDMSGALIVDIFEETATPEPKKAKGEVKEGSLKNIRNVFSESAFAKKKSAPHEEEGSVIEEPEKPAREEYVDTKTGHIYVQGADIGTPEQHPAWEKFSLGLQEAGHAFGSFLSAQGRLLRKGKKQSALALHSLKEESLVLGRKMARAWRHYLRKREETLKKKAEAAAHIPKEAPIAPVQPSIPLSDISLPKKESVLPQTLEREEQKKEEEVLSEPREIIPLETSGEPDEIPSFMREKLARFYQQERTVIPEEKEAPITDVTSKKQVLPQMLSSLKGAFGTSAHALQVFFRNFALGEKASNLIRSLRNLLRQGWVTFQMLPQKKKRLVLSGIGTLCAGILLAFLFIQFNGSFGNETPKEISENIVSSETSVPREETVSAAISTLINHTDAPLVTSVVLNDETYAVTEKSIVSVAQSKAFALPAGNDALYAAAMDDLRLIFIYTRSGRLYAFSPISKTFVENTLTLPEGSQVTGMGTYLTYLYVLDSSHDQIYRFPRADGGFGTGASWLKDTVSIEENTLFAVNESLFLAPTTTTAQGFFRGRQNVTLEAPTDGMIIESLYTFPDLTQVYALDREHGRLLVWNQEGKLLETYENESFSEGQSLSVSEKTNEAFIGTEDSLLSFKLK